MKKPVKNLSLDDLLKEKKKILQKLHGRPDLPDIIKRACGHPTGNKAYADFLKNPPLKKDGQIIIGPNSIKSWAHAGRIIKSVEIQYGKDGIEKLIEFIKFIEQTNGKREKTTLKPSIDK